MPCNSDYMKPSEMEINRQKVSSFIVFVNDKLNLPTDPHIHAAASDSYGDGVNLDAATTHLCTLLRSLTEDQLNTIVYNARDKTSRQLADWWDEHKKADDERMAKKKANIAKSELMKQAMQKLTPEELAALREGFTHR